MKRKYMMILALMIALIGVSATQSAHAVGEGSLFYNLAMGGACVKLGTKYPTAGVVCGFGITFAEYTYGNRKNILYMLAWSGGRMAKVTTPCVIASGVKYYCL